MPESRKYSRPGCRAPAVPGPDYCSVHRPGGVPGGGAPRGTLKALKPGLYAHPGLPRSLVGRNGRIADFDGCSADFDDYTADFDDCSAVFDGCSADSWLVQMSMVVFSLEGRNSDT